jgi:hypothetical protein
MGGRPFPAVSCIICSKPLDLRTDLSADENGKALHTECYVNHICGRPDNTLFEAPGLGG